MWSYFFFLVVQSPAIRLHSIFFKMMTLHFSQRRTYITYFSKLKKAHLNDSQLDAASNIMLKIMEFIHFIAGERDILFL